MNSTNPGTGKHCDGKLHKHGQINNYSISLLHANIFKVVCKLKQEKNSIILPISIVFSRARKTKHISAPKLEKLHIEYPLYIACRQRGKSETNLANLLEKLSVCQSTIQTRLIAFPVNGDLVTKSSFNISIQAIITDVGDATLEPLKQCNNK